MAPEAVEGADGGVGVRHAHVDVGPADGVGARVAQEVADALVALLVGDPGRALGRGGMRARAQEAGARRQHRPAQPAQGADGLAGVPAHVRDELDLAGVQLLLDATVDVAEPRHDGGRGIGLLTADGIDEEQLLLDSEREWIALPEGVGHVGVVGQCPRIVPARAGSRTRPG